MNSIIEFSTEVQLKELDGLTGGRASETFAVTSMHCSQDIRAASP